ncbi:hypothetical protein U9M48_025064 [Paspalum notatum var. saurae]|uniref:UDP-glycosyltransferases domain-containing protein n=1 Tax=Paspalum notatum var. saurae TaxID=547442 RepID=A0AAQ3TNJ4_PASNO
MAATTIGARAAPPPLPERPHVVLVASPGAGHLIPMAELARRLVADHAFAATLVTFADLSTGPDAQSAAVLSSLRAANVSTATLPEVPLDDLPADARIETALFELVSRSIPHLEALLRGIGSTAPLAALVPDFFAAVVLPLAAELGVPGYLFFPSNLCALSVMRSAVELNDGAAAGDYRDLPDPLRLPGGVSLSREDLPDGFRSSKEPVFAHLIDEGRRYRTAAGFLVNTFKEMEPAAVEEFKKAAEQGRFPPAYPVGPFIRPISSESDGGGVSSPCVQWLDCQPRGSVVYVSFGSAGALSVEQTAELATGLEDSGHRFLWVVRMPSVHGEQSDWGVKPRGGADENDPLAWLPEGFLERTGGRGLAVASWAPQVRVLAHPATAAFVSHCGWNSTLESVTSGVPMVAWPLHAEQRANAVVLSSENVGVALRLRARADGLVARGEVAAAVRELMGEDGRAVRRRTGYLQQAAAWAPEGSSRKALEEVAGKWKAAAAAAARDLGDKNNDTSSSSTERPSPACTEEQPSQQQVMLFASPGAGHLIPVVELARRLTTKHGLAVTVVTLAGMSDPATDAAVLSSLPATVATSVLPAVSLDDLSPDIGFGTLMFELVRRSLPHLRAVMEGGGGGEVTALVCDFFGTAALPLAAELGAQGYVFFPNSFAMISIMRHIVELHGDAAAGEYRDLPDPLPLPGGPVLRHADLPDGFRDRKDPVYAYLVEEARRYGRADGFLVNSFEELETAMAETFKRDAEDGAFPPVYPVGPFVRSSSSGEEADESACLEWLDLQPEGSVLYVSFGTGGALSVEQTAELAAGLEMSGHRFLWVVRMPSLDGNPYALGTIPGDDDDDPLAWLPEGFLERTRGRGLAVAAWAPQVRVLAHPATAAFVSHCGWNSTLESVAAGVPMVAWPLYAEQKMNAAILTEVTGVALCPAAACGDDGLVTREEIAAALSELVEGEKGGAVRHRAGELRQAAARAWSPEGSSRRALGEVVGKWRAASSASKQENSTVYFFQ